MAYKEMIFEKEYGVATITLNRPEKFNALTLVLREEIQQAIDEVKEDDGVRVLILTGKGRAFCAGMDLGLLSDLSADSRQGRGLLDGSTRRILSLFGLGKPTIAAVNGIAAGGGMSLAATCDIRLAGASARFSAAFVKRGVMPDGGLSYTLPRLVGHSMACQLMFTGDTIDARESERIGLVSAVVPDDQLMAAAREMAARIARNAPVAVSHTKEALYHSLDADLPSQMEFEAQQQVIVMATEDFKEGVKSFQEKREPAFKGK